MENQHVGVVLVNTGTPRKPEPEAVRAYLKRFLGHPRIRPMNAFVWSIILNAFILPKRGIASAEKYRAIWTDEGSPFVRDHERLVAKLNERFSTAGRFVAVRYAMSFEAPFICDALEDLRMLECERVVVLPLYPQSAHSTTGVVEDDLAAALKNMAWDIPCTVIRSYGENKYYIHALADAVVAAGFDASPASTDRLMMSYHSIPLKDIQAGDTYAQETARTSQLLADALGVPCERWSVGYQCRFDKSRAWLEPFTKDVMEQIAAGRGRLFYVCPNFSVDCLETLYDIEYEIKPAYNAAVRAAHPEASPDDFVYVPCLNATDAQVDVLIDVIEGALRPVQA